MSTPVHAGSVYVHAPFCARRCFYCDFAIKVGRSGDLDGWIEALEAEVRGLDDDPLLTLAPLLDTLYVGGGTPSLLGPLVMKRLADVLGRDRLAAPGLEWTAEANPETFTDDVARAWADAGVNRISLGTQTFHGPALRWMGRIHGPDGTARAVDAARSAGIDNVSVDLIFGLPGHLERNWRRDLDQVLALDVPHVSLYGLTVEAATPLGRRVREGREGPVDEDRYGEEFLLAADVLAAAGYRHYEVSNFARPGMTSRHNAVYWSGGPYLGLGNGAHSYAPPVRRWNLREWDDYRRVALEGGSVEAEREILDEGSARLERIWLGLRTDVGVEPAALPPAARALTGRWVRDGLARERAGRLTLTGRGWLLLDRLAVDLDHASG
jgi:oxygen-independent coproporphyrinogen-3 oxidase